MKLHIASSKQIFFEVENVVWFHTTLANGDPISVYPGHAPLIARIAQGEIEYRKGENKNPVPAFDGVLYIENECITCLIEEMQDVE